MIIKNVLKKSLIITIIAFLMSMSSPMILGTYERSVQSEEFNCNCRASNSGGDVLVYGYVFDSTDGAGIPNVTLYFCDTMIGYEYRTKTNSTGYYEIKDLCSSPCEYFAVVSKAGYHTKSFYPFVPPNQNRYQWNITLNRDYCDLIIPPKGRIIPRFLSHDIIIGNLDVRINNVFYPYIYKIELKVKGRPTVIFENVTDEVLYYTDDQPFVGLQNIDVYAYANDSNSYHDRYVPLRLHPRSEKLLHLLEFLKPIFKIL